MSARTEYLLRLFVITLYMSGLLPIFGCSSNDTEPSPTAPEGIGSIKVNIEPDHLQPSWSISGSGGLLTGGVGSKLITQVVPGDYTVSWNDYGEWGAPADSTAYLGDGQIVTFTGVFKESARTGTIVLSSEPESIEPEWIVSDLQDFYRTGSGDAVLQDVPVGSYVVTWEVVPGMGAVFAEQKFVGRDEVVQFSTSYAPLTEAPAGFAYVEPGSFLMGSPADEEDRESDEARHEVVLSRGMYVSEREITNGQWIALLGDDRYTNTPDYDMPITNLTTGDAIAYCNALSVSEGLTPAYYRDEERRWQWDREGLGYRLPTEAEWEYACRSGSRTSFTLGDATGVDCGFDMRLNAEGWYCYNADGPSHPGVKSPNRWGLYDMHGNVDEFCWDLAFASYDEHDYIDPWTDVGSGSTDWIAIRGGCWTSSVQGCRSADRDGAPLGFSDPRVGFRPVRFAY